MSARNRELLGLLPATVLVVAGFTAVFVQRSNVLSNVSLTYGAIFLALCLAGHLFIRITLPYADPYLFPLVALLASFGIVMIYRIDATDARQQAQWFVVGLILFAVTILLFRDYRKLEQYRYVIVAISLALLILPRVPGIGQYSNGAYLGIRLPGGVTFQPTEFAKVGLVVFLASYLRDTRQVLVLGARRFLGVTLPPLKHFGPVLVIWGVAMVILVLLSDIGSSVMFYGALLAMLYVATGRLSFVIIGVAAFVLGAWFLGTHIAHVHARFETWQHPFNAQLYHAPLGSYQVANGNFAMAAGGLFGQGFGQAILTVPGTRDPLIPFPQTDMIYAVITDELGLFGAVAIVISYLLFVYRGFKTAMLSSDSFSKLMAVGLSSVFALQVFVIVGGGHACDPAHRRHAAVHLLRRSIDRRQLRPARAAAARLQPGPSSGQALRVNDQIVKLFGLILVLFALLVFFTSRWTVFDASALNNNPLNSRAAIAQAKIKRGAILADDGSVLAQSVSAGGGTWKRRYPADSPLFAQSVGYWKGAGNDAGLELSYSRQLEGSPSGGHLGVRAVVQRAAGRRPAAHDARSQGAGGRPPGSGRSHRLRRRAGPRDRRDPGDVLQPVL